MGLCCHSVADSVQNPSLVRCYIGEMSNKYAKHYKLLTEKAKAREAGDDFDEREEACRTQYLDKRSEAIAKLKVSNKWTDAQAKDYFDGKQGSQRQSGSSVDSALRREVNLNHRFPGDRPI